VPLGCCEPFCHMEHCFLHVDFIVVLLTACVLQINDDDDDNTGL